jgi:hypothetical protein
MPKQVYHIKAFEGGINKKADPRDIEDNQLVEATNVDVSNVGRVTMPGNGKSSFVTVNAENVPVSPTDSEGQDRFDNETPISSGHGLFSFTHDYDFNNTSVSDGTGPNEVNTEFICVNDGADIDIWTDNFEGTDYGPWKDSLISMGTVHNTGTDGNSENLLDVKGVKPVYYKADNGLRVCDANFGEEQLTAETAIAISADSTTSFNVDAGHGLSVGEYIKIDSEVMKVTVSNASSITVERGRFGTKIEDHLNNSKIFKINVPKVLTHIKRPMLKKAGANTDINRWVQDIQVPEAPKYGALTVYPYNVISGENELNSNIIHPNNSEKVNLGISQSNLGNDTVFSLDSDDNPISSVTTTTETHLILTLSKFQESGTTPIDINDYNFAVGKFLSISGAGQTTASGTALNGVFEIIGFGSSNGQVKIIGDSDLVGYQGDGKEQIILEDEVMDDNLKNKYIFGMSYLYDGGGSEMQESDITTAVSASSETVLIQNIGWGSTNWKTANSSWGNLLALSDSNPNNYDKQDGTLTYSTANNEFLYYESSDITISANQTYDVSFVVGFDSCSGVTLNFYVGLGPGSSSAAKSNPGAEGFTALTVSQPTSGNGSILVSGTVTTGDDASHIDADVGLAIQVVGANTGGSEKVVLVSLGSNVSLTNPTTIMSKDNSVDFRTVQDIAKSSIAFLCNNSRTGTFNSTTSNNSWNERIEGFRIYMKQVDSIGDGLADEWLMLYDVDLKEGTYVMHAKDTDVENLRLGDISSNEWHVTELADARAIVTNSLNGDSIKSIPLITYEANNGYEAGTNLAARYKATATVDRKVYIGNLKIGDKTFPDRMLRSDTDKFDTFPDDGTHFIDVATSDGESIVALESVGDKLIQYKEKTAYVIKVTSEGEELVSTFSGAGVKNPCQIAKSSDGIFWVNSNGIYYYDGEKLSNVSADKFRIDNWLTNEDFKRPVIVGYDKYSNKLIILTTNISGASSSGYIYDISNSSVTQHDNLFNWYQLSNPGDVVFGNSESEV